MTGDTSTAETLLAGLPPAAQPIRAALFAILREGRSATRAELAAATNKTQDEVDEVIAALRAIGMAQADDGGRIVAADGLSLIPTPHQLVLDGVELHTWCAIDAVVIPAVIGADALAVTACGHCSAVVSVRFDRGRVVDGPGSVLWFPTKSCTNVSAEFCPDANLFCGPIHLDAWRTTTGNPAGEVLTLDRAVDRCGFVWAGLNG
jgi:alkylmercury lyase